MACNLFSVSNGYQISDPDSGASLFEILQGSGIPGGDAGQQDDAPIGSFYIDTATGISYCKQTDVNSTADWVPLKADANPPDTDTGVTTAENFGCILADDANCCTWDVFVRDNANPANVRCVTVKGLHNGTAVADATLVDCTEYSKLKLGSNFDASIDVVITGTGAAQEMCVQISSTETTGVDVAVKKCC